MLAVALTRMVRGTKLWLIFVGPSGDAKSEMVNCLDDGGLNIYVMHKLTARTIVSGNPKVHDLAPELDNKLIIISDFAEILTLPPAEKAAIWGQLRELYDGRAGGDTGAGKRSKYDHLNVTMIGCSTPAIDSQILIHQALGTRELIYRTKGSFNKTDLLKKVNYNEEEEEEMRFELRKATQQFLIERKYITKELDEETKRQLFNYASYLTIIRTQGDFDQYSGELNLSSIPEEPTRLYKQLKRLYLALLSLEDEYPSWKAMEIIKHTIKSSGNQLRQELLETIEKLKESNNNPINHAELARLLRVNWKTAYREANLLWNLRVLEKETEYDHYGRAISHFWSLNEKWEEKYLV